MIDPRVSLLVAGCVLFGALIVRELYSETPDDIPPARQAVAQAPAARSAPVARPAGIEDLLATVLARPLFSATRRPPQAAPGEAAGGPDLSDKRLAGIVIEPDRRFAIFAVANAKPLTVSEGDTVNGWRVESITPTEISLSGTNGTRTLQPTWDPAAAAQPRTPRPAPQRQQAQPAAVPPGQNAPAPGAAVQPPGAAPRPPVAPGWPANRAQAGQFPPGAPQNAAVPPNGIVRPGQRP